MSCRKQTKYSVKENEFASRINLSNQDTCPIENIQYNQMYFVENFLDLRFNVPTTKPNLVLKVLTDLLGILFIWHLRASIMKSAKWLRDCPILKEHGAGKYHSAPINQYFRIE